MERVVVFLDYHNVYYGARRAFFGEQASKRLGHVDPLALGQLIASRGPEGSHRMLQQVRIYKGMPVAARDPKGHAAAWRQEMATQMSGEDTQRKLETVLRDEYGYDLCQVVYQSTRPLRYPPDYPREKAREKGVDVMLAVDFVSGALAGRFDVGVIMSTDTDLYPALEAVREYGVDLSWPFQFPSDVDTDTDAVDDYFVAAELVDSAARPLCEVAAWRSPDGYSPCLRLGGPRPPRKGVDMNTGKSVTIPTPPEPRMWCHWLDRADYDAVADLTDYSEGDPPPDWA